MVKGLTIEQMEGYVACLKDKIQFFNNELKTYEEHIKKLGEFTQEPEKKKE